MGDKRNRFIILRHDIFLLAFLVLCLCHRYIPIDVSSLWRLALLVGVYLLARFGFPYSRTLLVGVMSLWTIGEAGLALLQHAHWAGSNHPLFEVTGTFGNPAPLGGLLALGVVTVAWVLFGFGRQNRKWIVGLSAMAIVGLSYALWLTQSRAAWLAVVAGLLFLGWRQRWWQKIPSPKKSFVIVICLLLGIIGSVALYQMKKDSADGRLLIARNTLAMIAERPLMGWGTGGWDARYMHCQADYFTRHPDSPYAMLADDVGYPYNEFLYVAAEQGLVGLLLVLGLLGSLYRYRDGARSGRLEKALLTAFVTFSLFSYPLSVFPLQMTLAALLGCMRSLPLRCLVVSRGMLRIVGVLACICLVGVGAVSYTIYDKVRAGKELDRLYPYFRYNVKLMERYVPSCTDEPLEYQLALLEDAITLAPTCEWYLRLGDACRRKGDWIKAEECYRKAASMIPHRLTPKFKLFELYRETGDWENAFRMAEIVVDAPVKKEGTRVLRMKAQADAFLQKMGCSMRKKVGQFPSGTSPADLQKGHEFERFSMNYCNYDNNFSNFVGIV